MHRRRGMPMPCVYFPVAAHESGGDAREEQASSGYRLSWYNAASAQYGDGVNFYSFSFGAGKDCLRQRHKLAMDRNSPRTIRRLKDNAAETYRPRTIDEAETGDGQRGYTAIGRICQQWPARLLRA